jgi:hypothetical protein
MPPTAPGGAHRDNRTGLDTDRIKSLISSFPRKREPRGERRAVALDPRFRGGDDFDLLEIER